MSGEDDFYDDDFETPEAEERKKRREDTPPSRRDSYDSRSRTPTPRRRSVSSERSASPRRERTTTNQNRNGKLAQSSGATNSRRPPISKFAKRKVQNTNNTKKGTTRPAIAKRSGSLGETISPRIVLASQVKMNELRNEMETWKIRCDTLLQENRTLKHVNRVQEKSIRDFDSTETGFTQVYDMQHEELRALRSNFRKYREKYYKSESDRQKLEKEHRSTLAKLQESEALVKEGELDDRHELQQKVTQLKDDLSAKETRISDLEKQIVLQEKLHKRELHESKDKWKAMQRENAALMEQITHLETQLRGKEHELEILNMYALRFPSNGSRKPPAKEQRPHDNSQLRSIPHRKATVQDESRMNHKQPLPNIEPAKSPVSSRHHSPAKAQSQPPPQLPSTHSTPRSQRVSSPKQAEVTFVRQSQPTKIRTEPTPRQSVEEYRSVSTVVPASTNRNVVSPPATFPEPQPQPRTPTPPPPPPPFVEEPAAAESPARTPRDSPRQPSERSLSAERKARLLATLKRIDHGGLPENGAEKQPEPASAASHDAVDAFFSALNKEPAKEKDDEPASSMQSDLRLLKDRSLASKKQFDVKHAPPKEYSFTQTIENLHRGLPANPVGKNAAKDSRSLDTIDDIFATPAKLPSVASGKKGGDDIWSIGEEKRGQNGFGETRLPDLSQSNKPGAKKNDGLPSFLQDSVATSSPAQKFNRGGMAPKDDFDLEELTL